MSNVEKIARLRRVSTAEAINFWKLVSSARGIELSTYAVLKALLAQGKCALSISAKQLAEKISPEAEKRKDTPQTQSTSVYNHEVFDDQSILEEESTPIEEIEFLQLITEISALGFTHSRQVSNYIASNKLGNKYKNISGYLEMELNGNVWDFEGGFPRNIYARLCKELGLQNQGTHAVARKFTPFKNRSLTK